MNPRAPIVARMCELLREQDRTIAWLAESLGVYAALLRRLVDGDYDIPHMHFIKVKRWVDAHRVAAPPKAPDAPLAAYLRTPGEAHLERSRPESPRPKHPTHNNATLSKLVHQLTERLSAVEAKLTQGAQP